MFTSLPSANVACEGYVFTSVCRGVCLSACWDTPPGKHPPGRHTPLPSSCWDTHTPLPSACLDRHGYCCRRYASYWNAFLFLASRLRFKGIKSLEKGAWLLCYHFIRLQNVYLQWSSAESEVNSLKIVAIKTLHSCTKRKQSQR